MSEVNITPNDGDTSIGLLAIVILILGLVLFGFIAYSKGWLSMSPAADQTPNSNINITIPAPTPTPAASSEGTSY